MRVRAFGLLAGCAWAGLALVRRSAWPPACLVAVVVSIAIALAVPRLYAAVHRALMAPSHRAFVAATAAVAAGLSWRLVHGLLRDTPLSIDAAVYLMQARAMSHGHFGMQAPVPMQAFSGHFLSEGPDGRLYGVFPPGWPLAIVPFVWAGIPMLVGPVIAALLVVAQAALGRVVARASGDEAGGEAATRVSLLLGLPSIARALETGDLLSHALVGLLAATAMAQTLSVQVSPDTRGGRHRWAALAVGGCVGWATASRLLDGLLLAGAVGGLLVWTQGGWKMALWVAAGAVPFVVFLAIEQWCATGAWLLPTQTTYFERSDWPPGCHRLGIGPGIGCSVEHKGIVAGFGSAGFGVRQAVEVTRERASKLGEELFGFGPLALFAFLPLLAGASRVDAPGVAIVLAFTLAYGLFYYGNSEFFGARHLFPVAPFLWLLAARGARSLPHRAGSWFSEVRAHGVGTLVLLAAGGVGACRTWPEGRRAADDYQRPRSDLRRTLTSHGIERGILKTPDEIAVAAAFDSWADDDERMFVSDDGSGVLELRRAHPRLPFMLALPHDEVGKLYPRKLPEGVFVELERVWPTFVRPHGLGASRRWRSEASGGALLLLSHAVPGAEVTVPFEIAVPGEYLVRVDGMTGPQDGNYDLILDGSPLPRWSGYSPEPGKTKGEAVLQTLTGGRHALIARCVGRDEASSGYDAELDALVGEPPVTQ
jgi:hypothetical protein